MSMSFFDKEIIERKKKETEKKLKPLIKKEEKNKNIVEKKRKLIYDTETANNKIKELMGGKIDKKYKVKTNMTIDELKQLLNKNNKKIKKLKLNQDILNNDNIKLPPIKKKTFLDKIQEETVKRIQEKNEKEQNYKTKAIENIKDKEIIKPITKETKKIKEINKNTDNKINEIQKLKEMENEIKTKKINNLNLPTIKDKFLNKKLIKETFNIHSKLNVKKMTQKISNMINKEKELQQKAEKLSVVPDEDQKSIFINTARKDIIEKRAKSNYKILRSFNRTINNNKTLNKLHTETFTKDGNKNFDTQTINNMAYDTMSIFTSMPKTNKLDDDKISMITTFNKKNTKKANKRRIFLDTISRTSQDFYVLKNKSKIRDDYESKVKKDKKFLDGINEVNSDSSNSKNEKESSENEKKIKLNMRWLDGAESDSSENVKYTEENNNKKESKEQNQPTKAKKYLIQTMNKRDKDENSLNSMPASSELSSSSGQEDSKKSNSEKNSFNKAQIRDENLDSQYSGSSKDVNSDESLTSKESENKSHENSSSISQ